MWIDSVVPVRGRPCSWAAARRLALAVVFGAVAMAAAAQQAALPAGVTRGPTVEGITEYRLANGLRFILFPDASKPTATVNITYLVGSRQENYGETGMAHLLEHLIFKGSKKFPNPDVEFNRRGFENNGTTWLDRTNYFSTFQASDDNLRWAIEWSADAMVNSFIAKKDLDSEMTVVRNELENRQNNPMLTMLERNQALLFDWHNYGNSSVGARSDIEGVRIENLQAFYRRCYQPDNAVLIVAGRFDEARVLRWIAESFGRIPRPTRTLVPQWTVEPTHEGERQFTVRRKGEIQLVTLAYRLPSALHPDFLAAALAADALADTPNGRLHAGLVASGKAAEVFAFTVDALQPGFVMFGAAVKKGAPLEPVAQAMIEIIEGIGAQAFSDAELKRTVQQARTSFDRALADPKAFGIGMSDYVSLGDWRLFFYSRDRLGKLSAAQLDAAATRYFVRDNRVLGFFIPEDAPRRAEIPQAPTPEKLLADYKPAEQGQQAEAFDPSQDNIDRRTRIVAIGDLQIALLPKRNRGETVSVRTAFRWGDLATLSGRAVDGELTAAMLTRGAGPLTRQQIADEMTRLQMVGSLQGFVTTRANLPDALKLVALAMQKASLQNEEFEQLRRETVTALASQLDSPEAISRDALNAHFNRYPPADPRYYLPLKERIAAVEKTSVDSVRSYHRQLYGTARGQIAIVGDFDDKAIEEQLRRDFAGFVSPAPYARIDRAWHEVRPTRIVIDTPDKENAVLRARLDLALRDDDPDAVALLIANEILGSGGGLSNRLMVRLRQKDGISYSVGSGLALGSRDRLSTFTIGALAAPQNANRAEQAIREEIENARRNGFSATEVADAKKGLLQERLVNRSQDGILASGWINNLDLGRTYAFSKAFEQKIAAVTVEQVNAAFRRHIDPAQLSFVLAGDTKKGLR